LTLDKNGLNFTLMASQSVMFGIVVWSTGWEILEDIKGEWTSDYDSLPPSIFLKEKASAHLAPFFSDHLHKGDPRLVDGKESLP
jgi:hypothetical protein